MGKKRKGSERPIMAIDVNQVVTSDYYQGSILDEILVKLERSVESLKVTRGNVPEKKWMKEQFAIGVNDVTRVLERMIAASDSSTSYLKGKSSADVSLRKAPLVPLQAIILAADCNPKFLTKHIPSLAASCRVAVIPIKDGGRSSLRLGKLVNVTTALVIGIKVRGSIINETTGEILSLNQVDDSTPVPCLSHASLPMVNEH